MGLVLDYKKWAIKTRIVVLEKSLRRFPDSPETPRRREELDNLKKDLADIHEE